ncbi:MAG TPA: MalY/PatB family protein [Anaerolineae bacterium]|nr:MalY/PatB family protein [Anaerolineae bacterium]
MADNFDQILQRRTTESAKWRVYPEDVLPLWVADMDFMSPEPVLRALRAAVDHGVFGYPRGLHGEGPELPEYADVIVARLRERYAWTIEPQDILFLPGIVVGLNVMGNMFHTQGGSMVVQPPVYTPILTAPDTATLTRREAPLVRQSDGTYAVAWDQFTAAFQADTRAFILCNPHNPVGRVFRRDELERMAEICLSRNVLICSDEIHGDLIYRGQQHLPIASLDPTIAQHTITFIAPSKTFNMPGLQASIAIIQNAELRQRFQAARQSLVHGINLLGLVAMHAAYSEGQAWLDQLLMYLEANRDFLYDFVNNELPGHNMAKPEGTYLAWIDCRGAQLENPYEFFLNQAKVALSDGAIFGTEGQGFVRMNFGCPRATLEEALQRMKQALTSR